MRELDIDKTRLHPGDLMSIKVASRSPYATFASRLVALANC